MAMILKGDTIELGFGNFVGNITHDTDADQDRTIQFSRVQIKKLLTIQSYYRFKGIDTVRVIYEPDDEVLQRFIVSS